MHSKVIKKRPSARNQSDADRVRELFAREQARGVELTPSQLAAAIGCSRQAADQALRASAQRGRPCTTLPCERCAGTGRRPIKTASRGRKRLQSSGARP